MNNNNLSEISKRFWKQIIVAVATTIGITVAVISIGISIDVVHIGDINIHTGVSPVDNTENKAGTNQPRANIVKQATIQLEDLEPCTIYEFQASLDPNFNDAETIIFTTQCEE